MSIKVIFYLYFHGYIYDIDLKEENPSRVAPEISDGDNVHGIISLAFLIILNKGLRNFCLIVLIIINASDVMNS